MVLFRVQLCLNVTLSSRFTAMSLVTARTYPRAALAGNPSDGYYGKTIAYTFDNFHTDVFLQPNTDTPEFPPGMNCHVALASGEPLDLVDQGGGEQLILASVRRFREFCRKQGMLLPELSVTIGFQTSIPQGVGLAGSSAIILGCFRVLMKFSNVTVSPPVLANEVLMVEVENLGIAGGLQDRVTQVYGGMVYMDFNRQIMKQRGYGHYEVLDFNTPERLYIAYNPSLAEVSGALHGDLRQRWRTGDQVFIDTMNRCAQIADESRVAIVAQDMSKLSELIDRGFDYRNSCIPSNAGNLKMIQLARESGASTNQAGSGGAITGLVDNNSMFDRLKEAMSDENIQVIQPRLVRNEANNYGH